MTYQEKMDQIEMSDETGLCDDCYDSWLSTQPHMKYFWDWEAWDRDHIAGKKIKQG